LEVQVTNLKAVERSSFEVNKNIENISKYQNIKLQAVAAARYSLI